MRAFPSFPRWTALGAVALVAACKEAPPQGPPPPASVTIEIADTTTVDQSVELVGTVEPFRRVEVRAPVAGVITARPFREGAEVAKGTVLYEIDRTVYAAAASSAQARLENAKRQVARLTPLLRDRAIAQRDMDDATTELEQAQAAYDRAAKDLRDATVRAEIGGRVGRAMLELGARVSGPADLLTTIDQLEPVYVVFQPSSQQLSEWAASPAAGRLLQPESRLAVAVTLPDGSRLDRTGTLDYVAPVLDQATGTREYRARFTNADRRLVPGSFVRVHLDGFTRPGVVTVPQRAVQQQLGRQVVYIVGPGDTVKVRDVRVGPWVGDRWIIDSGLVVGDRVIVDGFQKTGPGAVVNPSEAATASATPTGTPAGGEESGS